MPKVTVYIREEDIEAWKGVIKKTEFIHNSLKNNSTYDGAKIVIREAVPGVQPIKVVERLAPRPQVDIPGVTKGFVPKAPDPTTGYPCCLNKKPCKHWVWDGNIGGHTNSITGEVREAPAW